MSLSPSTHLEILNGSLDGVNHSTQQDSFTNFSQLPNELRHKIWRISLQRERMVQVCVHPLPPISTEDHAKVRYGVAVRGYNVLSKLLRVNREARSEVLAFYRIHIPCYFSRGAIYKEINEVCAAPRRNILFFNPEYDVLELLLRFTDSAAITEFLLNLHETDPRHVGICKLAILIDPQPLARPHSMEEVRLPSPDAATPRTLALRELLAGLNEVFLIHTHLPGQVLFTVHEQIRSFEGSSFEDIPVGLVDHTTPLHAHGPAFTRLPRDPRTIDENLWKAHISLGTMFWAWRSFLVGLGVDASSLHARMSCLLTSFSFGDIVQGRAAAEAYVRKQEPWWRENVPGVSNRFDNLRRLVGRVATRADTQPRDFPRTAGVVFGYWLFPLDRHLASIDRTIAGDEVAEDGWEFTIHGWLKSVPLHALSGTLPELLMVDLA